MGRCPRYSWVRAMAETVVEYLARRVEEEALAAATAPSPTLRSAHDALLKAYRSQLRSIREGQAPSSAVIADYEGRERRPHFAKR